MTQVVPVNDGKLYHQMAVSELTSSMYMVNITAGETLYTERLVIQP